MKRYSANYILPINSNPIKNGIVVIDDNNQIAEIIDPQGEVLELASMEFHNGIIVPGFINAHCHLELSNLRSKLDSGSEGIAGFVSQIRSRRTSSLEDIQKAIKQGLRDLEINGTVAVGDICNTADTFVLKQSSDIFFHNFIELFGLLTDDAEFRFYSAKNILKEALTLNRSCSLTPHATYSISDKLWTLIRDELRKSESIVSIHYGESQQEYDFLSNRTGTLAENFKALGIDDRIESSTSPFDIVQTYLPLQNPTLFVHNTFSKREEVEAIISHFDKPFFVLCPSSNLFIEGRLPDVPMLNDAGACIALGTDSYASSNTLSVFDQAMVLLDRFQGLTFNEVMQWSTLNGARALGVDYNYGSLEKGKKPGLNLITDFDFAQMRPTSKSRVKRLV